MASRGIGDQYTASLDPLLAIPKTHDLPRDPVHPGPDKTEKIEEEREIDNIKQQKKYAVLVT
jgi:hypothetical protein